MKDWKRAERALRKDRARFKRTYGLIGNIVSVEQCQYDETEKLHGFAVKFDNGALEFFEVRLYAKSWRVYG
jgi:hypothetical protein